MLFKVSTYFTGLLLLLTMPNMIFAQQDGHNFRVALEAGPVWQNKNNVRIPGDTGTKFSFKDLTGTGPYPAGRFIFDWNMFERHGLRLTIAPLRFEDTGTLNQSVAFADKVFAPDITTTGKYKFDTYRIAYRYLLLNNSAWRMQIGGTLLLRDAKIELAQADVNAADSNVGVVPLLNWAVEWNFARRWSTIFDFEGLASTQGRALDLAVKLNYALTDRWDIGGGYRILEGGADNDDVYNFALFNYGFLALAYQF